MPNIKVAAFVVLVFQSVVSHAGEITIPADYLYGRWSFDGKAGCGSSEAGYVLIRENGTLEVGRSGQVNRIGFWRVSGDTIVANTLTKPTERDPYNPFFGDTYRYEYVTRRVVKADRDSFTVVMGSDLEKQKRQLVLTRCP